MHQTLTALPPNLLGTLRSATSPDKMQALASLDRKSRDELTALARQFVMMLDQSPSWKPQITDTRLYLSVNGNNEAKAALDKLHALGCDQYPTTLTGTPVAAIFVDRKGRYSFLFNADECDQHFGELARNAEWTRIDIQQLYEAKALADLQPRPIERAAQ